MQALIAVAEADDVPAEVQLGGADVLTYREMMARYASLAGRRHRPLFKVPLFTPTPLVVLGRARDARVARA